MCRRQLLFLLFLVLGTSYLQSCGDESSDPAVVEVSELLGPGEMNIVDDGAGTVTLYWNASNPEDDFEGFNIYGGKMTASELEGFGANPGQSLQLLSQTGEPSDVAKTLLQRFDYNAANENALPGAPTRKEEEKDEDDKPKFDFLPIHKQDAEGQALVPTCQPEKSTDTSAISCLPVTSDDSRKDAKTVKSYGTNKYSIDGLTAGVSYCFLIFSVQDEGEEISQSSSTVQCVIPKVKAEWSGITLGSSGDQQAFDLNAYADACVADTTTCPSQADYTKVRSDAGGLTAADAVDAAQYAIHFEAYGTDGTAYIVGGKHVAIKDVGYFTDFAQVPDDISEVSFPSTYSSDSADATKNSLVGGGYTRPFASVVLMNNHVYVIAIGDQDGDYPKTFTYHWMHISTGGGEVSKTSAFTPVFLINKTKNEL